MTKRSFTPEMKEKVADYHGMARFTLSERAAEAAPRSLNLNLSFEEAMKLNIALQAAILSINRINRGTPEGRRLGICLAIKFPENDISVTENVIKD